MSVLRRWVDLDSSNEEEMTIDETSSCFLSALLWGPHWSTLSKKLLEPLIEESNTRTHARTTLPLLGLLVGAKKLLLLFCFQNNFLKEGTEQWGSVSDLRPGCDCVWAMAWLSIIEPFCTGPAHRIAKCLASLSQEIVIHKESEQKIGSWLVATTSSTEPWHGIACLRYSLSLLSLESWDCEHYLREKS